MKHTAALRRFGSHDPDPANAIGLRADHPALAGQGRTLFPTTVVGSLESPRFLVSGHNNPKLGKTVLKGPRTGWPIFHLTLEERATCPRTCEQWSTCFGNAMPQARRHAVDDQFLPLLRAEVATLARANPKGLLIRLHALGDFYSAEYVLAWAEMLAMFPQLAVFGYTARRTDDRDPQSAKIARVIELMTDAMWERFSIRTSASDPVARSRAIVVDETPADEGTIVCPAQVGATEACATCGLCWAGAARDKTIAFLKHGMTNRRGVPARVETTEPPPAAAPDPQRWRHVSRAQQLADKVEACAPVLLARHPAGVPIAAVMEATGAGYNQATVALCMLHKAGKYAWVKAASTDKHKVLRPASEADTEETLTPHQQTVLDLMSERAVDGAVLVDRPSMRQACGLSMATFDMCVTALRRKGFTKHVSGSAAGAVFQVLKPTTKTSAKYAPNYSDPIPAPPALNTKDHGPPKARPSETTLWEPVEPVSRPRAPTPVRQADLPPTPAPAPPDPVPLHVPPEFDEPMVDAPPNSLLALGYRSCKWPTNDPPLGRGDLMRFCCAETEDGATYCPTHAALATTGGGRVWTPEQRAAHSMKARARIAAASTRRAAEARA